MKNILVILTLETHLRNWIQCGTFKELEKHYNVNYAVVMYDWDPELTRNFGIKKYILLNQNNIKRKLLLRFLGISMFRYAKFSKAFRVKTSYSKVYSKPFYKVLALPSVYKFLNWLISKSLPIWRELEETLIKQNISIVIMPSLATDSWTLDMIRTTKIMKVKSLILINSWDNLVSKGVLPQPPDWVGVWGKQGLNQAVNIQKIHKDKILILGAPRFDMYFDDNSQLDPKTEIYDFNKIPLGKKIILYAATSLPFDDVAVLKFLDNIIREEERFQDFVILFRPHPESLERVNEVHISTLQLKNVYLDKQMEEFYNRHFDEYDEVPSYINKTSLDYYPKLLNSVVAMVSTPTTLSLEGALNKIPCLMICYNDGKHHYLSPDVVAQFEYIKDLLTFPGIVSCFDKEDLTSSFSKLVNISQDEKIKSQLFEATRYILFRDEKKYPTRLLKAVEGILN
jgi:hypothetical protein